MNDPVYAEKYAEGASRGDLAGKAKQAIDARHVAGLGGWFVSGGMQQRAQGRLPLAGAEIGYEFYPVNWFSHRAGLSAYFNREDGFAGIDGGCRFQLPARITPFAGAGAFAGVSRGLSDDSHDGVDNDNDLFVDESDEQSSTVDDFMCAVYPEVGSHFWLTGSVRTTVSGKYLVSSLGRDQDDWLLGGQLTFFNR
jgi:hypothetical protein